MKNDDDKEIYEDDEMVHEDGRFLQQDFQGVQAQKTHSRRKPLSEENHEDEDNNEVIFQLNLWSV